ncbi:cbl-interacting protein kinase 13 [Hordeum vulgare]|uniref:GRF-type domain-containing protein n=1 Tax=Hordeum vulgare subsp. vulgare TaxID=112509 RepID=A0A8I6XEZ0_HORVV|nr:cbl-interacting protein kinase 13 [Hordeum vulgare]
MVSWSEGSSSSWDDESVNNQLPRTVPCYEWSGIAHELSFHCMHLEPCVSQVAFQSTDTSRRFLVCAKEKAKEKCCYLEWIDPEWSVAMQFCIGQLWSVHDKENEDRIRENLKLGEENFKIIGEKSKMEEDLRFFKLDFAIMVTDKEEAINQLGSARLSMSDLKEEIEKKKLADHSCINLHQVLRAKAQKERDQMKKEKKKLEYIISDMMKQNHGYKDKVKKLKEICDQL